MRKIYSFFLLAMLICLGCEWRMRPDFHMSDSNSFVLRYDRIESFFLTTGDFSAMQQMQTRFPEQTRTLIENVLELGKVDEPQISSRFLSFFQDTTLLAIISEVDRQYSDLDGLDTELEEAFVALHEQMPNIPKPIIYTQIGSLDQSIVVKDSLVGISLDKYLGDDNPLYIRYGYTPEQRHMMTRRYIVPDCLAFYLLAHYPAPGPAITRSVGPSPIQRAHMSRIQLVVNRIIGERFFDTPEVHEAEEYMNTHELSLDRFLSGE